MSRERRREMVDRRHPALSTVRQCALLNISRSSLNYRRKGTCPEDLAVMKQIDEQYLATPFYGSRRIKVWLGRQGHTVNRKRVQRLMRVMGLRAIYRRPRTSKPGPGHKVYPYLLGRMHPDTIGTDPIRCGRPTSPTSPWPRVSSTWWPSWTGTAGMWWPGAFPTLWMPISASRHWRKR